MLPFVAVPSTIAQEFGKYRDLFCRGAGFEQVSRYVTGLLLSGNKTLQGIAGQWVSDENLGGRRAMHAAVFEARWQSSDLMAHHRSVIAKEHQGRGREVISLDWTLSHHDWGKQIFGVKRSYDYVEHRMSCFQTVVTATIANRHLIDGIDVVVQFPDFSVAEREYLKVTAKSHYDDLEQVRARLIELLHYHKNRLEYRKRTEIAVEIVRQVEMEGQFPTADYAFDNGVLTVELTTVIETAGKHWVSEIESSRNLLWHDRWQRADAIGLEMRTQHPESFRPIQVTCRNGETKQIWAFSKVLRLKKLGRKRLVIVHESEDLQDAPRFLLTDALHWESGRIMQTWSYRWSCEVFHEVSKQQTGFESAQVRNQEAVNRHFRLSCVAHSILQRTACSGAQSERFGFAQGKQTVGQKLYTLSRQVLDDLLQFILTQFAQGQTHEQILQVLLPC